MGWMAIGHASIVGARVAGWPGFDATGVASRSMIRRTSNKRTSMGVCQGGLEPRLDSKRIGNGLRQQEGLGLEQGRQASHWVKGDFNVEPKKIPCLAKGISAGRWVDLESSWAFALGRELWKLERFSNRVSFVCCGGSDLLCFT